MPRWLSYPDPSLSALRSKLAECTGIPADGFTFGNGSTEIIDRVLRTFARPGETVVATDPTWPVFERMCRLHGIGIISVPYNLDLASGCAQLDLNRCFACDRRSNPTGLPGKSKQSPGNGAYPSRSFANF